MRTDRDIVVDISPVSPRRRRVIIFIGITLYEWVVNKSSEPSHIVRSALGVVTAGITSIDNGYFHFHPLDALIRFVSLNSAKMDKLIRATLA
jgi:hypothetical protein